ncbi:MAG: hypothetical protein IID36_10605 [Planctomycetes bacterium]|nr:hypothetical protein [Planctomycetota bacterium]
MNGKTLLFLGVGCAALAFGAGSAAAFQSVQPRMGDPLDGLTVDQMDRFIKGKVQFVRVFTAEEGLGPIFNKDSCGGCHSTPVGGTGSQTVTRAGLATKGGFDPLDELGGSLFQQEAISDDCREDVPEFANVRARRATNGMMGYGLVQAIADDDIAANADPDDLDGDGISGRVRITQAVDDLPKIVDRVGRFGWKAHSATMLDFSAGAALNEVGITNVFHPEDNDPNGIDPPELADCDDIEDPEDIADAEGFFYIERVADFQRFLAAPPQTPKSGMTGEGLFIQIGCNNCHLATVFTTPDDRALEDALRNKPVKPYSDFLLHNMGQLGDGIVQGPAGADEFRTTPLMGFRMRDPIIHDGRVAAGTFEDRVMKAIAWHAVLGSEALDSGTLFLNGVCPLGPLDCVDFDGDPIPCPTCPPSVPEGLNAEERGHIIAFLNSLGRAEFDADGDNDIDVADYLNLRDCFTLNAVYTADDPCAIHDRDQDGDVDFDDLAGFRNAYTGSNQ